MSITIPDSRQLRTWIGHAALSTYIPPVIGVATALAAPVWTFAAMALASVLQAIIMTLRELRDRRKHIKAGRWTLHMERSHITPQIDMWGDLLGPLTATACYLNAWLVSLLVV